MTGKAASATILLAGAFALASVPVRARPSLQHGPVRVPGPIMPPTSGGSINSDVSANVRALPGLSTLRTLAAIGTDRINVRDCGAQESLPAGPDNVAFNTCLQQMSPGQVLFIPQPGFLNLLPALTAVPANLVGPFGPSVGFDLTGSAAQNVVGDMPTRGLVGNGWYEQKTFTNGPYTTPTSTRRTDATFNDTTHSVVATAGQATTTGSSVLMFAYPAPSNVTTGAAVSGPGVPSGATVGSTATTTISGTQYWAATLSTAVSATVPLGSAISFDTAVNGLASAQNWSCTVAAPASANDYTRYFNWCHVSVMVDSHIGPAQDVSGGNNYTVPPTALQDGFGPRGLGFALNSEYHNSTGETGILSGSGVGYESDLYAGGDDHVTARIVDHVVLGRTEAEMVSGEATAGIDISAGLPGETNPDYLQYGLTLQGANWSMAGIDTSTGRPLVTTAVTTAAAPVGSTSLSFYSPNTEALAAAVPKGALTITFPVDATSSLLLKPITSHGTTWWDVFQDGSNDFAPMTLDVGDVTSANGVVTVTLNQPTVNAMASGTVVSFGKPFQGAVENGMTMTGSSLLPAGETVLSGPGVGPSHQNTSLNTIATSIEQTGTIPLTLPLTTAVPAGTTITFTAVAPAVRIGQGQFIDFSGTTNFDHPGNLATQSWNNPQGMMFDTVNGQVAGWDDFGNAGFGGVVTMGNNCIAPDKQATFNRLSGSIAFNCLGDFNVDLFDNTGNSGFEWLESGQSAGSANTTLATLRPVSGLILSGVGLSVGGHVVATGAAPSLSNCGSGAVLSGTASDRHGTVTAGSGTTSCTITFRSAYGAVPDVLLTGWAGASPTISSVTAGAVTVATAAASKFTYLVEQ